MGSCSTIMAIIQENRIDTATKVQDILTKYGCHIRVRLGLHEAKISQCVNSGIILLQICSDNSSVVLDLENELKAVNNVRVKHMTLD